MDNALALKALEKLLAYVEAAADEEAALGPAWLADLSANGVAELRKLRKSVEFGRVRGGPGFDVAVLLGISWVNVHSKVEPLVRAVNREMGGP